MQALVAEVIKEFKKRYPTKHKLYKWVKSFNTNGYVKVTDDKVAIKLLPELKEEKTQPLFLPKTYEEDDYKNTLEYLIGVDAATYTSDKITIYLFSNLGNVKLTDSLIITHRSNIFLCFILEDTPQFESIYNE